MKIERCPRGHFFDGDRYEACPLCPPEEVILPPQIEPTVGWLVCTEAPWQGRDFRLHAGCNYIGSDPLADISLPWDALLGPGEGGILCYDGQLKLYSFGPRGKGPPVGVNGKMVLDAVILSPRDYLTVGSTAMLFVPLCGPGFCWDTCETKEERCTL